MEDLSQLPEGSVLVMRHPGVISDELAARIRNEFEARFPGKKLIVLGDGMSIESMPMPGQLDRIEQKLDAARRERTPDEIDELLIKLNAAALEVDHDLFGLPLQDVWKPRLREIVRDWIAAR